MVENQKGPEAKQTETSESQQVYNIQLFRSYVNYGAKANVIINFFHSDGPPLTRGELRKETR